jgi:ABC-2 type transport system ATP-binding protein
VTLKGWEGNKIVLELDPGADDQLVLQTALSTGPVREFTRRQATLTELFRTVVTTNGEAA